MEYSEKVIEHFRNPRHVGEIKTYSGKSRVGNIRCGDVIEFFIEVKDDKIIDAKFQTLGCAMAIAASDVLCELSIGKTIKESSKITARDIANYLGSVPKIKFHCSILGREALTKAIKDYKKK